MCYPPAAQLLNYYVFVLLVWHQLLYNCTFLSQTKVLIGNHYSKIQSIAKMPSTEATEFVVQMHFEFCEL
jgi:hypothetical protein